MSSKALANFTSRLEEVDQLIEAHGALVRLRKAEDALKSVGGELSRVGDVIKALVAKPGRGRPPEVQALNSAAIALLSGHAQGYFTDVYDEAAELLLKGRVVDIHTLTDAAPTRGNPTEINIERLFG